MLTGIENALVVKLDAENGPPCVGMTLTTHRADFPMDRFRTATAQLFKWMRTRWEVEYLGFLEWTTGKRTAGKRPHQHVLLKGLEEVPEGLEAEVSERWKRYTGGAWRVEVRELRTPAGAITYLAQHHHKREQAPPPGFKGRRLRPSKGYYSEPIATLRERAKAISRSRAVQAAVLQAFDEQGIDPVLDDDLFDAAIESAERIRPEAVRLGSDGIYRSAATSRESS
jgi:hypothetical protein